MKKYKIIYVIIYLLLLIVILTRGINIGIEGNFYDDYYDSGIIDGFSGSSMFLIYNLIMIISIFIIGLIVTFLKNNKIKYKSLIFIGIIILLLFVPVSIEHCSGGVAGINIKIYTNILSIPIGTKSLK